MGKALPLWGLSFPISEGLLPDPEVTAGLTYYSGTLMVAEVALRHTGSTRVPPGSGTRPPQTERLRLLAVRSGQGFGCFCLLVTSRGQTSSQQVTPVSAAPLGTLEPCLRAEVTLDSLGVSFHRSLLPNGASFYRTYFQGSVSQCVLKGCHFARASSEQRGAAAGASGALRPCRARGQGGPRAPHSAFPERPPRCPQMIFPMPDHVTPCSRSKPGPAGLPSNHTSLCTPCPRGLQAPGNASHTSCSLPCPVSVSPPPRSLPQAP